MSLLESLRNAVKDGAVSRYKICKLTAGVVTAPELSRWVRGQCCLGQAKLDAIATALGAELLLPSLPPAVRRRHHAERVNALAAVTNGKPIADRAGLVS